MILLSSEIPDLDEWVEAHDVGPGPDPWPMEDFGRGFRIGVAVSLGLWVAFIGGLVSC